MGSITLNKLDKVYANGYHAVDSLTLDIEDGEFLVLVGPSGCGKSTALRMIAGLEDITGGDLTIDGRDVKHLEPKDRDIAMVFQSYALYPHLTVRENIAFPLTLRKAPKEEVNRRVDAAARTLELTEHLEKRPAQLSGGQRQRVAMGRAIVRQPSAFLMDEPLSNLDAKLRVQMRAEISNLQRTLGITTIYVTHDQIEAMTMGTRVAVLSRGVLQQVDSPQRLYDEPRNLFVASFIGSPQMNTVAGDLQLSHDGGVLQIGGQLLHLPASFTARHRELSAYDGRRVVVGVRPEHFEDALLAPSEKQTVLADVVVREGLGSEVLLHATIDAHGVGAGDGGRPVVAAEGGATLVARVLPTSTADRGQRVALAIDIDKMYLFDIESGARIA